MTEYNLRLDADNLHDDLHTIREARKKIQHEEEWGIRLLWKDSEGENHHPLVCVKGPALSVKSYITTDGLTVDFSVGSYNYKKSDRGCFLWLSEITTILEKLERGEITREMIAGDDKHARTVYVMCVFVASEMVRNEVLEAILLKATADCAVVNWHDYCFLYKNWASASCALYGGEQSERAPVIRINDMKAAFLAGTLRADVANMYRDIFTGILG